ncbi:hypothetical protein Tco_0695690, partial [Tanacetum coccineum]
MPSYRTMMIREEFNEEEQRLNLDLLQERREAAAIEESSASQQKERTTTRSTPGGIFRPGECFVYRRKEASRVRIKEVGPKWEGPIRSQNASRMAPTSCKQWRTRWSLGLGTRSTCANTWNHQEPGRPDSLGSGRLGEEEDTSLGAPGQSDKEDRKSFLRKDKS